jgi:hypothetical protein
VIQTAFDDGQAEPPPAAHSSASPNLLMLLAELQRRWPEFDNLGCFGLRPIRGGTAPSSHCYGAAIDCGYPASFDETVSATVCAWIVARSEEMHVDAIHDYRRSRIWRAGRSDVANACTTWWRAQRPDPVTGMGQAWANHLHLETTAEGWSDGSPMLGRWTE